ncbi:uncharacterized protein ACMZJ9_021411, partial [Mantella aurantiaca]
GYGGICNVKHEFEEDTDSEYREHCEVGDDMKSDSSPELIMKVEEDVSPWGPPSSRDRIPLSKTEADLSPGISSYSAPSTRLERQRRPAGAVLSRRGDAARFLERERLRNVKFSDRENNVLVKKISENYEKILGRLITGTSASEKKEIWRKIVAAVNNVSHHSRSVAQCKKRYSDIKKKVKEKLSKQRAGTQLNVFFWPYEKHMLSLLASKMAPSLNGGSPTMSDDEDSTHTLTPCPAPPRRRNFNDGGQKADILQTYQAKEDMTEKTATAATDQYSDPDQDSQENGDLSETQCDSQQSSSLQNDIPNEGDPHQTHVILERSLRHLSACVKTQTATLRQTNIILRNLSTNMQNGFQMLAQIIQQATSVPRPDDTPGTTALSSALPTSVPQLANQPGAPAQSHALPTTMPWLYNIPGTTTPSHVLPTTMPQLHSTPKTPTQSHTLPTSVPQLYNTPKTPSRSHTLPTSVPQLYNTPKTPSRSHALPTTMPAGSRIGRGRPGRGRGRHPYSTSTASKKRRGKS